jgi:hypothetical protein
MTINKIVFSALAVSLATGSGCSPTPQKPEQSATSTSVAVVADSEAAHRFVQKFYDWYTAGTAYGVKAPAGFDQMLANYLDASLAAALRADAAAQRDSAQFRQSLSVDPFLFSQDPCPRYEVAEVRRVEGKFVVTMRPVCANATAQKYQNKQVAVEVARQGDEWRIHDVSYLDGSTLKGRLCNFAREDSRPDKRPARCP